MVIGVKLRNTSLWNRTSLNTRAARTKRRSELVEETGQSDILLRSTGIKGKKDKIVCVSKVWVY